MRKIGKVLFAAGALLVLASFGLLAFSQLRANAAKKETAAVVAELTSIFPERYPGVTDTFRNMDMPAMEINGQDYIGVVEIPAFGLSLPVGSQWNAGKVTSFPCRFWGTVYDGSLIIGGADQPGQFDCLSKLDLGTTVIVADMTGAEFTYGVSEIRRSKSADREVLMDDEADLTLFVRDAYELNYILVRCTAKVGG